MLVHLTDELEYSFSKGLGIVRGGSPKTVFKREGAFSGSYDLFYFTCQIVVGP